MSALVAERRPIAPFSLPNRFRAAMDSIVEAVLPIVET